MAYIDSDILKKTRTGKTLLERIHWERVALLGVNFALWALIVGFFS